MEYSYNSESLSRHRVSISDVNEVLAESNSSTCDFELPFGSNGNLRVMFVGYNLAGRLLEIGVEFISELTAYVFHAQAISPRYRRIYEQWFRRL